MPHDVCGDANRTFYLGRRVCRPAMQQAAYEWLYDERYGGKFHDGSFKKWSDKRSVKFPYGHRDGVELYVTEVDEEPDATWHQAPVALPRHAADGAAFLTPDPPKGGDPA